MTTTTFSYSATQGSEDQPVNITVGTLAPNAGQVEVRISNTNSGTPLALTKQEVRLLMDRIWRFLDSSLTASNDLL